MGMVDKMEDCNSEWRWSRRERRRGTGHGYVVRRVWIKSNSSKVGTAVEHYKMVDRTERNHLTYLSLR